MRATPRLTIVLVVAASAACSLFADTSDLERSPSDAAAGADDADALDGARLEAAVGDATLDGDASGGDAAADAPFCVGHDGGATLLCDDFDDPNRASLLQGGWAQVYGFPFGDLTNERFFSPPRAARFFYADDGGTQKRAATYTLPFPAGRDELVVTSRITFVAGTSGSTLSVGIGSSPSCEINYYGFTSPGRLVSRCPDYRDLGNAPPVHADQWNLVRVHARRTGMGVNVELEVGETAAPIVTTADVAVDGGVLGAQGSNAVTIELGESGDPATGTVYYDDVLAEAL